MPGRSHPSQLSIEVQSKIVGGNPTGPLIGTVLVEVSMTRITVTDLIRRVVEEQVWDLMNRRKLNTSEAQRALERQYLTDDEVAKQAAGGAVRLPRVLKPLDPEREVRRAIEAFEKGTYLVLVNGRQVAGLSETLTLAESSRVTFLRLTPLVGG